MAEFLVRWVLVMVVGGVGFLLAWGTAAAILWLSKRGWGWTVWIIYFFGISAIFAWLTTLN